MTLTLNLGDMRIDRIIEQEIPSFDIMEFFPNLTQEVLEEHREMLEPKALDPVTGLMALTMQSYVVRVGGMTILIDSCIGNHKDRPTRPTWHQKTDSTYMDALNAAGMTVEDIDIVMCTHLHPDHVGWNTKLEDGRWVPTFPNAKYVFSENELNYWTEQNAKKPIGHFVDSVLPIVEAGRAQLVKSDVELTHGVQLLPTPGHTPDHYAVRLSSGGQDAIVTGDLIHSPIQCACTHLHSRPDVDREQGLLTRNTFMDTYAETDTLIAATHFPSPSFGHFVRKGDAFGYRYRSED
jgi:glyoxylase-like metal-dependent hydrolase (beta-lactamase superfamily II)